MNNQFPYIGVTGVMTGEEAVRLHTEYRRTFDRNTAKSHDWPSLMVGGLVSSKTLFGETNKYPNRYPAVEVLSEVFIEGDGYHTLNLVHYSTDNPENLAEEIDYVVDYAGRNLTGIQFNAMWPSEKHIAVIRQNHPNLFLVLQVGHRALESVCWKGYQLQNVVKRYGESINGVLLDPSGGRGELLDAEKLSGMVRDLMEMNLAIGVAGGLSAETMEVISPLADICSYLSVDAEGRLRDEDDNLDFERVRPYFDAAVHELWY